jgi:P-aminobenzoate N-oxygenase AurF
MATVMTETTAATQKVDRLNTASIRRVIEPEERFDWSSLRAGQLIPDDLLSIDPDRYGLSAEQRARLSREEVASLLESGIRFECVLMAAFALQMAEDRNLVDPRSTYALHEIGEETRHSRAFLRLIETIGPESPRILDHGIWAWGRQKIQRSLLRHPTMLYVFVLAGEEIPDLMQKLASEHPDTDRLLAEVNRYHRQEEARHLAFARLRLPELHHDATRFERWRVRNLVPVGIKQLFESMLDPGIYRSVGLPPMRTWLKANRSARRKALRYEACRPILEAVIDAGFVPRGRVSRPWRTLCGVDRHADPLPDSPALPAVPAWAGPGYSASPTGWPSRIWSRYSERP